MKRLLWAVGIAVVMGLAIYLTSCGSIEVVVSGGTDNVVRIVDCTAIQDPTLIEQCAGLDAVNCDAPASEVEVAICAGEGQ